MKQIEPKLVKKFLAIAGVGEVVLVDNRIAKEFDPSRNVFLINGDKNVVWQIDSGFSSNGVVGYSDIYLSINDGLMAYSSNGVEYEIDSASGRVMSRELIR